jgi:hypothetical protein
MLGIGRALTGDVRRASRNRRAPRWVVKLSKRGQAGRVNQSRSLSGAGAPGRSMSGHSDDRAPGPIAADLGGGSFNVAPRQTGASQLADERPLRALTLC